MTELEQNIETYVTGKVAAQQRAEAIIFALSPGQLQRVIDVASDKELLAPISAAADKLETIAEQHPLGEYLSKRLREASDAQQTKRINDELWKLAGDNRLFQNAQNLLSGVGLALVYGDMLSDAERQQVLAPYRAALGSAAAI